MADNIINRASRDLETREKSERKKSWVPPSVLPELNPEPGYAFKWVRLSTLGVQDPSNLSSKLRSGYEAVKASDHPEHFVTHIDDERFKDNIVIGGLIACKIPVELVEDRKNYYSQQVKRQNEAVDNNLMRESDPRMPVFQDKKTKVTFGSGN